VEEIYRADDIYTFDTVRDSPDLVVVCSKGYQILAVSEIIFFGKYVDELFVPHRWSGRHEQHGVFLVSGPNVVKEKEIEHCSVIDIAPSILYLMGEPIPDYMDGRLLKEAIDRNYLEQNPEQYSSLDEMGQHGVYETLSKDQEKAIEERLKDLGYME